MDHIVQAVVASTYATNQGFIPGRTPYLFAREAVEEVAKQINQRRFDGKPIQIFLHPPAKSKAKKDNLGLVTSLVAEKRDTFNAKVGQYVGAELEEDREFGVLKCIATIQLTLNETIKSIKTKKKDLCFITQYDYDAEKSLKKLNNFAMSVDQIDDVYNFHPPLTVLWAHIGLKRSCSNPYLVIL